MVLFEMLFSVSSLLFFLWEFLPGCLVTGCGFPSPMSVLGIDHSLQHSGNSLCFPLYPFTVHVLLDHRRLSWITCSLPFRSTKEMSDFVCGRKAVHNHSPPQQNTQLFLA